MSAPLRPVLRVALVGYAFMGRAHSNAWQQVERFFPDLPCRISRQVICGRSAAPLAEAAATWGWAEHSTDVLGAITRDDIDIVDICTPNDSHHDLAMAAILAGKQVLCEKPLALELPQARRMAAAAGEMGVRTFVWHNYRRSPAAATMQALIAEGRIGEVRQVRATYLQDWLADDSCPWLWRMDRATCGSGAHGDLNAHIIDLIRHVTGQEFSAVCGLEHTFTPRRRLPGKQRGWGTVDVDDAFLALGRLDNGATVSLEASRVAWGRKNRFAIEINGSRGTLCWNLERLNELELFDADDAGREAGFRTIMCMNNGAHPYAANYWPDGHTIGYEHTFVNSLADWLRALHTGEPCLPDFADAVRTQSVLDACLRSAQRGTWITPEGD